MHLTLTDYFIVGFLAVGIMVDMWFAVDGGQPETISFRTALWSRRWPLIPLAVGMLIGHLFWPNLGYCS